MGQIKTIEWCGNELKLIDCTKLPLKEEYLCCKDYTTLGKAIKELVVRGAPAIGVSAAYGVVLASIQARKETGDKEKYINFIEKAIEELKGSRPTAVNLFWALDRMHNKLNSVNHLSMDEIERVLLDEAHIIYKEDEECNRVMGRYGNEVVPQNANILTHCNAGALATAAYGTALGVIRAAKESGKNIHVYVDETRPLLQGARLTAWEMVEENIPATLITDNMAGYCMKLGKIDLIITGADRITLNGDTANKIGTYSLAVLAKHHNIPFYIAAPFSTIDVDLKEGSEIKIEERAKDEVRQVFGVKVSPENIDVFNPAFDVTPNELIAGIITEKGILRPPYDKSILQKLNK